MNRIVLTAILILGLISCNETSNDQKQSIKADSISKEENEIDETITNIYESLSYDSGRQPDYEKFSNQFVSKATIQYFIGDSLVVKSIEEFTPIYENSVKQRKKNSFYEYEIAGKTEWYGKIAHRFNTYEAFFESKDSIIERGISSFQLVKVNGDWLINSLSWEAEKEGQLIPKKYLGGNQ